MKRRFSLADAWFYVAEFALRALKDENEKCIRMGITVLNSIWRATCKPSVLCSQMRFTAPLSRRRETKFAIIKPTIDLLK